MSSRCAPSLHAVQQGANRCIDCERLVDFTGQANQDITALSAGQCVGDTALAEEPGIDLDARFRADNQGGTSRNFDLTFMITAEVIDVRPNGNLVIEAKKRRFVNSDEEILLLTGEVSPKAIINNVVKSEKIANLDIRVVGEGPANSVAKPGLMTRILDWLWPF